MRIGQLHRLAQRRAERMQAAEARLRGAQRPRHRARSTPTSKAEVDFNVRWGWAEGPLRAGMTAIVRVKNEARALPWTLPPLLRAVDRVVLIDNGSTDGTASVGARGGGRRPARRRSTSPATRSPSRAAAPSTLATPEASVHSLAYFYNWSFAHVRTSYALKWDGDMVLSDAAVAALRDLAWQLEAAELIVRVPRLGLYVADERLALRRRRRCATASRGRGRTSPATGS